MYAELVRQEMEGENLTTFGTGDIVGCGIQWGTEGKGIVFWTKNGLRLGKHIIIRINPSIEKSGLTFSCAEPDIEISRRRLYPAVGLKSQGADVRANFGATAFRYEPDNHNVENGQLNSFGKLGIADAASGSGVTSGRERKLTRVSRFAEAPSPDIGT